MQKKYLSSVIFRGSVFIMVLASCSPAQPTESIAGQGATPSDNIDSDVAVMDNFIYGEPQRLP